MKKKRRLSLGLDMSTQSLSAAVLDIDSETRVCELSLDYLKDPRLNIFGLRAEDYILPPLTRGEASQPPQMYLAALDCLFSDLRNILELKDISVINSSAQQHGHVYLNSRASSAFAGLCTADSERLSLTGLFAGCFSCDRALIWMTSCTGKQAEFLRNRAGGKKVLIRISGSDAQLRYTGIMVRWTAENLPGVYNRTATIHLISSLITAVLCGKAEASLDFGNACGMALMDYCGKAWSDRLINAVSWGLPGGEAAFRRKLPSIAAPDAVAGKIALYFVRKYGFSPECLVITGSGDNLQSRVLSAGDQLSLGSSLVIMVSSDSCTRDTSGAACSMYDGAGKPFIFGCRTNGSLVWDMIRTWYGLDKDDYQPAEAALEQALPGKNLVFWQPRSETFPPSGNFELSRIGSSPAGLANDYPGLIESSLAAVYRHSRVFSRHNNGPLYVTGGATGSRGILRRAAAIWKRPVIIVEAAGAATGAATAGAVTFLKNGDEKAEIAGFSAGISQKGKSLHPSPEDIALFHSPGGYLDRFAAAEERLLRKYPLKI